MKNKTIATFASILIGLFLASMNPVLAQTPVHFKGRISDDGGGAFESLHIIVENSSGRFEATTNDNGEYDLLLPPGIYKVSTSKVRGFKPYRRDKLEIKPGKDKKLNIKLKVEPKDVISVLNVTNAPVEEKQVQRRMARAIGVYNHIQRSARSEVHMVIIPPENWTGG